MRTPPPVPHVNFWNNVCQLTTNNVFFIQAKIFFELHFEEKIAGYNFSAQLILYEQKLTRHSIVYRLWKSDFSP